ncbi:hypothetical protein Cyrtocomes_00529 [Candidatus Cyrtobacter comes]|uniref:Bacteriocin n=1 Tax=Candidatus Cyrtobacter comes TaxID=675776 RepID=A0ABU5L7Q0_9RICK|nr:hypothetical protein [Candidatus Cyrtobacter comes]
MKNKTKIIELGNADALVMGGGEGTNEQYGGRRS